MTSKYPKKGISNRKGGWISPEIRERSGYFSASWRGRPGRNAPWTMDQALTGLVRVSISHLGDSTFKFAYNPAGQIANIRSLG